ncbi:MAG: PBP1A family penicillin-binding protein [Spirochaetia bacterium]|nr:PBP1A family penicillin-binding protein [Spirochaetia bacterium]
MEKIIEFIKKLLPLKRLIWLVPVFIVMILGLRFGIIYIKWNSQKETVLNKLIKYKQQLDRLRNPMPAEESGGDITLGAVAIPSRVYDINGKVIGEFFTERRTLLPLEKMPSFLPKALIASEDRKYYEHEGINYTAILRAFIANIFSFKFSQGGSTLTQQLAKILFTTQEKTLDRKIFEYFCAKEIEEHYTKDEILEMYLNLIFMGHSNYGFESAAGYFFSKSAANLTLGEAAILVGLLPNPTLFSPINDIKTALKRQSLVLSSMVKMSYINNNQKIQAEKRFKKIWKVKEKNGEYTSSIGDFPDRAFRINLAPHFLDYVMQSLLNIFDFDEVMKGGLQIYTTLDYKRQSIAQSALEKSVLRQKNYYSQLIKELKKKGKKKEADIFTEAQEKTNGAFIVIHPKSGYVLALIGGNEFSLKNQFNRAILAKRQVGSLIKPFVYYTAIKQQNITAASIIDDSPMKIGDIEYNNYDNKFLGQITVTEALKQSRNIPAIKVLQAAGIDEFREVISNALHLSYDDVSKNIPRELGVALGTSVFTPIEMAKLFSALVNDGISIEPRFILRVDDKNNKLLWEAEPPKERKVFDSTASYIVISILQKIFENEGTASWVYDLREKNPDYINFEIAGKTGTTSDYKDAWFAGLTSDEVSIIWLGADNNITLGSGRSGGALCSPVWIEYIKNARSESAPIRFLENKKLEGITKENFCAETGGVPRAENLCPHFIKDQVFYEGTEPRYFCPLHKPVVREIPLQ